MQLDAALTMDAVEVIARGLDSIQDSNPDIFREVFRRGKVYNNDTIGLDCKNDLPVPWTHGNLLINKFKQASLELCSFALSVKCSDFI